MKLEIKQLMKYKSFFLTIALSSFFSIQCFSFDKNEISPYLFKENIQKTKIDYLVH